MLCHASTIFVKYSSLQVSARKVFHYQDNMLWYIILPLFNSLELQIVSAPLSWNQNILLLSKIHGIDQITISL